MRMIFLSKSKDIAHGCRSCRFRTTENTCLADPRVSIFDKKDDINEFRPYCCPFRYFDECCPQIIKKFEGMTEEETKGWFEGADSVYKRYCRLEDERYRYVESLQKKNGGQDND